jgi:predicted aspartyl protease
MRVKQAVAAAITICSVYGTTSASAAECGPLKQVTSIDTKPSASGGMLVPVKIGDAERLLLLDTGGAVMRLTPEAAQEFNLTTAEMDTRFFGVTGRSSNRYAIIPSLSFGRIEARNVKALVLPLSSEGPQNVVGTMVTSPNYDLELDFSGNRLALFASDHCQGRVVYWPTTVVAVVPVRIDSLQHMIIPVTLDGKRLEALIDTGSSGTFLDLNTAQQVFGVDLSSPDVKDVGHPRDAPAFRTYQRRFNTLAFDGVTVSHPVLELIPDAITPKLRAATRSLMRRQSEIPDVTLGMSVLGKLHMYIAYKERKVYITPASNAPGQSAPN